MNSALTKLQVSRILAVELKKSFLSFQVLALFIFIQILISIILFNPMTIAITIIMGFVVYLDFKRIGNRIDELKNKYEGEQ